MVVWGLRVEGPAWRWVAIESIGGWRLGFLKTPLNGILLAGCLTLRTARGLSWSVSDNRKIGPPCCSIRLGLISKASKGMTLGTRGKAVALQC